MDFAPSHVLEAVHKEQSGGMNTNKIISNDMISLDVSDIRPFRVNVPEAELTELRRRISATKWPERETVTDQSQGVQLATIQKLARYWATDYDWRKCRGETERPTAVHDRDRWARHSFHSRSFET